jgi:ElaB/YqjD/DUF883 family membrane-anchored ribosome-binding protein
MDEEKKKAYQDRFQARIDEWEAKLEQLGARARKAEADLRLKLQDEESDLRKHLDEARDRLRELKAASGDGWEEIRAGADRLWTDLRAAWERAGSREKEGGEQGPGGGPGTP